MNIIKRSIALIIAALMCLTVLVGCKSEQTENNGGNTVDTTLEKDEYTDAELRAMEKDNLPDWVSTKYQGRTISTYSFKENFERDVHGKGKMSGDTFYDLIYKRNC